MRQNTHKGMFNSSCISNDVECELFMSDIEFTVNLSFIIKIWVFLYACLLRACLSGWYHTHTNISHFQRELSFIVTFNMFCFCLLCMEFTHIYIYKNGGGGWGGEWREHIKKNMLIICQCCLQSYSLLLCYIHV